jgi:hypothetical protein
MFFNLGNIICEISGSHGGEYEDGCLLCCCTLIALFMGAVTTYGTSLNFYQIKRRNNPADSHLLEWNLNGRFLINIIQI